MERERKATAFRATDLAQRLSQVAGGEEFDVLLDGMLEVVLDLTATHAGMLALYEESSETLVIEAARGSAASHTLLKTHLPLDSHELPAITIHDAIPIVVPDVARDPRWNHAFNAQLIDEPLQSVISIPLRTDAGAPPTGLVQVFNAASLPQPDDEMWDLLHATGMLMSPLINKARRLADVQRHERRLRDLIDIMSCMTTTLERDRLLDDIMNYAQELMQVEATSIWIKDEATGELVLHIATGGKRDQIREIRVPGDQGIIGHVTTTGQQVVVNDVRQDAHFYRAIDDQSGFNTRSIMCVPLRAPKIELGGEQGTLEETIIGGAQALNKRDGYPFSDEDVTLFEMLASQSATVLQLSRLYHEMREMFRRIIKGITSFIDRKDPYTRGHSQRVADFSVAIAQELGLPQELIHHIRIGGILHDVGKIAVPDEVLKKPSRLTDDEMEKMKLHPTHGIELLEESDLLRLLTREREAIEEHHERLDGTGYPRGLKGKREEPLNGVGADGVGNPDGISLIGRIVAVADVFDAMASDRPYRPAMSVEKVIGILRDAAGTEFDPQCVEALVRAREHGTIVVQSERPGYQRLFIEGDETSNGIQATS